VTPPFLSRLRWTADDAQSPQGTRAVIARSFAYLYGAGATLVLLTLAFPTEQGRHPLGIAVPACIAYAVVATLLTRFDRLPMGFLVALPTLGTVLVSVVLIEGGGAAVAAYAMMYFWVVLSAHYFFDASVGAFNTGFVSVAYAVVLVITPDVRHPEVKWLMATGALGVSGLLMTLLRGRVGSLFSRLQGHVDQSDALALFSRRALDPDAVDELPGEAVRIVHDVYGFDCAGVTLLSGDGQTMHVAAASGWRQEIVGTIAAPTDTDTLTGRALASDGPLYGDDHPELKRTKTLQAEGIRCSVLVPLRGRGEVYGLLTAHSREENAFSLRDTAGIEALAGALAGAMDRARSAERLAHQAYHDDLTGQPNRHLFMERLDNGLSRARADGSTTAVLFLDLDNFKVINDSLGHPVGDALLLALVPRLRKRVLLADTIARFGGDEFVLLCEGVDGEAGALAIAEALHAALEEPIAVRGAVHRLTASIGVALAIAGTSDSEALVRSAAAALSRAKASGRNQTALYDAGMHAAAMSRLRLEGALRESVGSERFRLVYQPIVDIADGRIVACEALLRFRHPALGEVSPAEMIPVAEETGLIVEIGEWVLAEACRAQVRWRELVGQKDAPAVTVNVSPRQLIEPTLAARAAGVLRDTGADPGDVVIEITESVLIDDTTGATDRLEQLRGVGLRLALDDFGTGYSSLAYLQRFAVDSIKIDRSFVSTVDQRGGDTIVGAVLGLASGLGASVVAEGIETPGQLERLRALGCRNGQGYLLSRPVPSSEIEALLGDGGLVPSASQASSTLS
jgi:diguanylate cyclase (GGDEF)-like protein